MRDCLITPVRQLKEWMQFLREFPYIRQTRMTFNSEWYSINWRLSVMFDKFIQIHTSNFLDLITDKFTLISSSYQVMGQFFSPVLE